MTIRNLLEKINEWLTVRNKTLRNVIRLLTIMGLTVGLGSMVMANYEVAMVSYLATSGLTLLLISGVD